MKRKEEIEEELEGHINLLKALGVGMDQPLVDSEGFPRADIDLYQIRETRQKVNMLKNDAKDILNKIEKCLHEIHLKNKPVTGQ